MGRGPTHTRETEMKEGILLTLVGDVGLKGGLGVVLSAWSNVWLSTFSVRQRGQRGGVTSVQCRVSKSRGATSVAEQANQKHTRTHSESGTTKGWCGHSTCAPGKRWKRSRSAEWWQEGEPSSPVCVGGWVGGTVGGWVGTSRSVNDSRLLSTSTMDSCSDSSHPPRTCGCSASQMIDRLLKMARQHKDTVCSRVKEVCRRADG